MDLVKALQFIKVTIEQNVIAAVKNLKSNIFTVQLKSDKVTVTNPTILPETIKVKEINPINNKKDIDEQTKKIVNAINDKFAELNKLAKELKPLDSVSVDNLSDIPVPSNEVRVLNPVKKVSISNFYEIQKEIGKLQKIVQGLKLDQKIIVPEIKIPEIKIPDHKSEINLDKLEKLIGKDPEKYVPVRLSDGKKFYEALEDFSIRASNSGAAYQTEGNVKTQAMVDKNNYVLSSNSDRWGLNHTYKSGATTYMGQEDNDANWLVTKIVKSAGTVTMTYATNKNNTTINTYSYAWSNRATINYTRYSGAF